MFKTPPPIFGEFKQLSEKYYENLKSILEPELPRSRRTIETLKLTIKGHDTSAFFYIPKHENPIELSGMVIVLFGEYPDPTTAFSYFSKEQDVETVRIIGSEILALRILECYYDFFRVRDIRFAPL